MGSEHYRRLFRAVNTGELEAPELELLIADLGPSARAFRAFAYTRRHAWTSARTDLLTVLGDPVGASPLVHWVTGAGLFIARDYSRAIAGLIKAAAITPPTDRKGVRVRARKLAVKLCSSLGWVEEARELRTEIALQDIQGRKHLRSHTLEIQRQAAIRRRAQEAVRGPVAQAAHKSHGLAFRDGVEAASAALTSLRRSHPRALEPLRAKLRLELMRGRLDVAAAELDGASSAQRDALRAEVVALALAQGELEAALTASDAPGDEPRLLYLRGLTLGRLSQHRAAAELLERARLLSPDSIGVLLALALHRYLEDPDRRDESINHRFVELVEWAPALMSDAALATGVALWSDHGVTRDRHEQFELLRGAEGLLTAEHDLALTSYAAPGHDGRPRLRHVANLGRGSSHLERLHAEHAAMVGLYEATLVADIGVRPERPEVEVVERHAVSEPEAVWTPRLLTPAQIEQFLGDGFIVIPKALDVEFAARVRTEAIARIRNAPHDYVRDYKPDGPSRWLSDFDPARPMTWKRPRLELRGPESWDIEEIAPTAWTAICDLLGGPGRIATKVWGNYLLLSLRYRGSIKRAQPGPDSEGWHIDDPSPTTRLTNIRNGLVCVALFDDLLPRSGNTWLAPDSVGRVARELAAHPEGVDFIARRGSEITVRCKRFHEVVGQTGDVVLMHPLLMHSASNNRSDRIRWMANPMIYLNRPLDPFRDPAEMSPVEFAIHRAIQA